MRLCHVERDIPELPDPDPDGVPCCWGKTLYGPERCDCWVPVYDLDQAPLVDGPVVQRSMMCADCAFRPDSPERTGDQAYANAEDGDLEELVTSEQAFFCHQGLRQPAKWVHPPTGVEVPGHPGAYRPPIVDGVPRKADGTPADICAGWAARRRAAAAAAAIEAARQARAGLSNT